MCQPRASTLVLQSGWPMLSVCESVGPLTLFFPCLRVPQVSVFTPEVFAFAFFSFAPCPRPPFNPPSRPFNPQFLLFTAFHLTN